MAFSEKAKLAVAVYQDVETKGLHADHIVPKSKGGPDDVANLQFLTPALNMEKSNRHYALREWQQEFLHKWREKEASGPFLLVAIPGSGKTVAALTVAKEFLAGDSRRCLINVVPTSNLQEQWQKEATVFGIHLQTKEFGTNFKTGFTGGAVTYQSLEPYAQLFKKICSERETMVILDEPHHCGDKASWGVNTKLAFELAHRKLLLSGTPFRTDRQPIPFVTYDGGGLCVAHARYDYPDALRDGVVRVLAFEYGRGKFTVLENGPNGSVEQDYELHQQSTPEEAEGRLRKLLNSGGNFVREQIRIAHTKLQEFRKDIPDAAAMAVCIDQQHARDIAKLIHEITGSKPAIIVSDEDTATESVKDFRRSTKEWLVSVRQVSEGTDIKRLQVLCYLTNATTDLFFRQLVGRVSRVRFRESEPPNDSAVAADSHAWVILPADPRLIAHAKNIENAQKLAIEEIIREERECNERDPNERPMSIFLGSEHLGNDTTVIGTKQYDSAQVGEIQNIHLVGCMAGSMNIRQAAMIFEKCVKDRSFTPTATQPPQEPITRQDQEDELRRVINQKAYRLSMIIGCKPDDVHLRFPKRQKQMSLDELREKLQTIQRCILKGSIN